MAKKLKILVCVKHVPDMEANFKIDPEGVAIDESGLVFRANGYDEFALEESARIREKFGDVEVTALSVGPVRAEAAVRRGIEFGADFGTHIVTGEGYCPDAYDTARIIASYAREPGFDLLIFGVMSEDEQRCQVGPMTASLLDLPCATTVIKEDLSPEEAMITVERELEGGRREVVEMSLPAAITVQSGINLPRYPNLTNKLRARSQQLTVLDAGDPNHEKMCGEPQKLYYPPPAEPGLFIEGTLDEQAEKIISIIHEKTDVL